jgi:LmbE family N-acetylglucosaminyl deacetylase
VIPAVDRSDRLMVLAAHPDDESVATGGLLQHALANGAEVLVVFVTDGDNNPWAQRATELRWRIAASDRARFGVRRRAEARRALARLEVPDSSTRFLAFPDQGLTDLLLHANDIAMCTLADLIREWRPTIVVGPSLLDLHPDHSALGVMLCLALGDAGVTAAPRSQLRYLVHNPRLLARHEGTSLLPLSASQRRHKRAAITCHRTQMVLRSTWLLSFASREEMYYGAEPAGGLARHPVRAAAREGGFLSVSIASRSLPRSFGARNLCLVGGPPPVAVRLTAELPARGGDTAVRDPRSGARVGTAHFLGRSGRGTLRVPADLIPEGVSLFAKVERAVGFFDEAGWRELPVQVRGSRSGEDA